MSKPISAEERAAKVLPQLSWFYKHNENGYPYLIDQIKAAERKAREQALVDMAPQLKQQFDGGFDAGFELGRAQALEDAAKVCADDREANSAQCMYRILALKRAPSDGREKWMI